MTNTLHPSTLSDICLPKALVRDNSELLTEGQVNWLIKTRHLNGLGKAGAVLKISGKLYIKKSAFFNWFIEQKA